MHTNLKLVLACATPSAGLQITIHDRNNILATVNNISQTESEVNFKFSVPNQLIFVISNSSSIPTTCILKKCSLGGHEFPPSMLNQICNFTPSNSTDSIVTTNWWQNGKAVIDFFAGDWVQYHLLYNNKIIL